MDLKKPPPPPRRSAEEEDLLRALHFALLASRPRPPFWIRLKRRVVSPATRM